MRWSRETSRQTPLPAGFLPGSFERVSKRIGLIPAKATADEAHDLYLALLEPDQMYEAHVNLIRHGRLICHARKPGCVRCPVAPRCRYLDRRAP